MNVLMNEYTEDPKKPIACPIGDDKIEDKVNKYYDRLYKDVDDIYGKNNGYRQFYTNPNTTIPNDQAGFARFCYGDMISCKEGSDLACSQKNLRFRGN